MTLSCEKDNRISEGLAQRVLEGSDIVVTSVLSPMRSFSCS